MTDVFKVQDEIAGEVVAALKVKLLPAQQLPKTQRTRNPEAYEHYLLGMDISRRDRLEASKLAAVNSRKRSHSTRNMPTHMPRSHIPSPGCGCGPQPGAPQRKSKRRLRAWSRQSRWRRTWLGLTAFVVIFAIRASGIGRLPPPTQTCTCAGSQNAVLSSFYAQFLLRRPAGGGDCVGAPGDRD